MAVVDFELGSRITARETRKSIVAEVDSTIQDIDLTIVDPDKWRSLQKMWVENLVHAMALAYAFRYGRYMQARIGADPKYLNEDNIIDAGFRTKLRESSVRVHEHNQFDNASRFLIQYWAHGPILGTILAQQPNIIHKIRIRRLITAQAA